MLRYILALFELTLPSQLRPVDMLLGDVLRKALFAFEEAPVLAQRLVMPIQPDQEQRRDDRPRYGARHALGLLRHLHLAKMETTLQFFDRDLHAPTPRVYTEDGPRARLREIGPDALHAFRPIVTPFLREYDRDLTQMMQRRTANKAPLIVAAAVRLVAGTPRLTTLGQMLDQITQMLAIRKLPCPGHRKDVRLLLLGDQAQGLMSGTTGISPHHDLLHPGWRDKILQPLPPQAILVPTTLGIEEAPSNRDATTLPTRNPQPQLAATLIRVMLPVAGEVAQGMLTPPLRCERTVANQIQHAVGGRGQ
jgi:hypothetical protein